MTSIEDRLKQAADRMREQVANVNIAPLDMIERRARRSRAAAGAAAVILVAGGVTASIWIIGDESPGDSDRSEAPGQLVEFTARQAAYELPLNGLLQWEPDAEAAQVSHLNELTASCMNERGFAYPASEYAGATPALALTDHPFSLWEMSESDGGYSRSRTPTPSDATEQYVDTLPRADARAWWRARGGGGGPSIDVTLIDGTTVGSGFSEGFMQSCSGYAADQLFAGEYLEYEAHRSAVEGYVNEAWERTESDPAVTDAVAEWSACMGRAGHSYEDPQQPGEEFAGTGVTDHEQAVFEADVACKQEVDLFSTWFTTKAHHEQDLLDEHREIVDEFWRIKSEALTRLES